jgi:hypothetical protein
MKTCSFRGARPNLSHHQGLFCLNEPEIRYGMTSCHQHTCQFCFPSKAITTVRLRQQQYEPVVRFSSAQKHRFVSGYEAILNCPTVSLLPFLFFFIFSSTSSYYNISIVMCNKEYHLCIDLSLWSI